MTTLTRQIATRPVARRGISLARMLELGRQRRALARLDDARLNDLGLTRDAARQEARRPIWDIPAQWSEN